MFGNKEKTLESILANAEQTISDLNEVAVKHKQEVSQKEEEMKRLQGEIETNTEKATKAETIAKRMTDFINVD